MAIMQTNTTEKPNRKRLIVMLAFALLLTIWVLMQDDSNESDVIELAQSSQAARIDKSTSNNVKQNDASNHSAPNQNTFIPWQKLKREPLTNKVNDVFKVHSWVVAPKLAKSEQAPPPPPVAPPAPFTYMGKLEDSPKGTQVFLMRGGKLFTAVSGQKIDAQWRLDSEDGDTIQLTYLPLNLPQVIAKSAKSINVAVPVAAEANL